MRQLTQILLSRLRRPQGSQPPADAGLTLLECLVAIAIIGITSAVIAPALVFAVGTRVQNQRAEQALQLAQAEIDRARRIVEVGGDYRSTLDNLPLPIATAQSVAANVPAPTVLSTPNTSTAINFARPVDVNGDGQFDFAVQMFRTRGPGETNTGPASTPVAFQMGVRVYEHSKAQANLGNLLTDEAGLTLTSGDGQRSRQPLAVVYSQLAQGDRLGVLCDYWEFLGSTPTGLVCN
jgi:prepilin-type N-terminal cleavage/methylation domain-containing protein